MKYSNSVVSIVGKVVLATLLMPAILHNDSHNTNNIIVQAQIAGARAGGVGGSSSSEESTNTANLRGNTESSYTIKTATEESDSRDEPPVLNDYEVPIDPNGPIEEDEDGRLERVIPTDEEMEENPANLDLVEGMMRPPDDGEEEDDGGIVMAHSIHGLPDQPQDEEPQETAVESEQKMDLHGFLGGDGDSSEFEGNSGSQFPPPPRPFQDGGMIQPPPGAEFGGYDGVPPMTGFDEGQRQPPMQPPMQDGPSDMISPPQEGSNQNLNFGPPPRPEVEDIEGQMGPIPNKEYHKSQQGALYPELRGGSSHPQGFMGHEEQPQFQGSMNNGVVTRLPPQIEAMAAQNENIPFPKESCPIPAPKAMPLEPTMVASYPGSGAKLTWKLIRAISGYMTSDDAVDIGDLSKNKMVIAIKTHYPARGSSDEFFAPFIDVQSSILLLRNPFSAIPSFLSFLYEQSQNLTGHSVRAPLDVWVSWRDRHFEDELGLWANHARFWMKHHPFEQRMILPYEYLIKPGSGPTELRKVRTFLEKHSRTEFRTPVEKVACIWDYIVMKREDQGKMEGSMRKGGPKNYPYTPEQIEFMINTLEGLKREFPKEIGSLMELYIYQIKEAQIKANY